MRQPMVVLRLDSNMTPSQRPPTEKILATPLDLPTCHAQISDELSAQKYGDVDFILCVPSNGN